MKRHAPWTTAVLMAASVVAGAAACARGSEPALASVAGGNADRGSEAIRKYGCGSCHVIPGVRGARGKVGPPLTDFARRSYVAGTVLNTPENLVRWIRSPQAVQPGTVMPNLGVNRDDARDIAVYLYTLGSSRAGPPRLFDPGWMQGR